MATTAAGQDVYAVASAIARELKDEYAVARANPNRNLHQLDGAFDDLLTKVFTLADCIAALAEGK